MAVYKISNEIYGHDSDIRQVAALANGNFVTASRDCTAKLWHLENSSHWENINTFVGHKDTPDHGGVASVHYVPPQILPMWPNGVIATGGYDCSIMLWDPIEFSLLTTLIGDQSAILTISHAENGDLLSGSSDNSIAVWRDNSQFKHLLGHSYPVWCILSLPNGNIVSGSGDKTIKIWRDYQCIRTLSHHKDSVRSLCLNPEVGFISSSNDNSIKMWSFDGKLLDDLIGHTDTVYSTTVSPSKVIISGSEDSTVRIWSNSECKQVLNSRVGIWHVAILSNSDIIAACQDGFIRIWSCDPSRILSDENIQVYEQSVKKERIASDNNRRKKSKIGNVEYDHVFDIIPPEGSERIKLGFNNGEDPKVVARKFMQDYKLAEDSFDQIVDFISKATQTPVIESLANRPTDPYMDYSSDIHDINGAIDSVTHVKKSIHFPAKCPILFDSGNFQQIFDKIEQFCDEKTQEIANQRSILGSLKTIVDILKDTRMYHVSVFDQKDLDNIFSMVTEWPRDKIFPWLDLARLGMIHPDFARKSFKYMPNILNELSLESPISNKAMTLKTYANVFRTVSLREHMIPLFPEIFRYAPALLESSNRSVRVAISALIVNFSILFSGGRIDARGQLIELIVISILSNLDSPPENVYNGIVALGTLLTRDRSLETLVNQLTATEWLQHWTNSSNETVSQASKELLSFL